MLFIVPPPQENLSNQSRRCEELGKQNALLHQQMDEMAARSRQQQQQQQQLDVSFSEEEKTTEQILEILRYCCSTTVTKLMEQRVNCDSFLMLSSLWSKL